MDEGCRRILASLRTYVDGETDEDLERVVAAHLEECPPCLDRADFEQELKRLLASKCRDQAPPDLIDSVVERLRP